MLTTRRVSAGFPASLDTVRTQRVVLTTRRVGSGFPASMDTVGTQRVVSAWTVDIDFEHG